MISNAFQWLESKDFQSWLSFIIFFFDANGRHLEKILEPFFIVAEYDKEFCNFFLMMIQKMESEFTEGKRSGSQEFLEFLKEKRVHLREDFLY